MSCRKRVRNIRLYQTNTEELKKETKRYRMKISRHRKGNNGKTVFDFNTHSTRSFNVYMLVLQLK